MKLGKNYDRALLEVSLTAFLLCQFAPALAEWALLEVEDSSITAGLEAGLGVFGTEGANFGTGRFDLRTGEFDSEAHWQEAYVKPYLGLEHRSGAAGTLYGGVAAVGAWTGGDGDVGGYTNADDQQLDWETLYAGWRSGELLASSLGEDAVDMSYGRQDFQVGDGFLIWDGNLDQFDKGAYWLGPRTAFYRAGFARINTQPARADLFYLDSDRDHDYTELVGANLEYIDAELGSVGAMYFHVLDAGEPYVWGPREGMDVWSVRATEVTLPSLPNLNLWGQYVRQTGDGRDGSFDAEAWFVELRYGLANLPWSPSLSYRYAHFSGDPDSGDDRREDFDPFFYGWSRGWGTWFQGEITGEYLLFNSNQNNHMLHLAASPSDELGVGLILYRFDLDQPEYYGTPVSSTRFADELNLYADWSLNDNLSVSAAYALASPRTAAEEAFGDDDLFHLFELALYVSF